MSAKVSLVSFMISLVALLVAICVAAPGALVLPPAAPPIHASFAAAPALAGQSGVLYFSNHGNWG